MYFNNVEERKEACENEKKEYIKFLQYIQVIKNVAMEFDGKVINVRFKDKLSERLNHYVNFNFEENLFYIEIYSDILSDTYTYIVDLSTFDKTDSGKYRMNAKRFCKYVSLHCTEQLEKQIALYKTDDIDEARKEFAEIATAFEKFKEKYSYKVIEFAGCDFRFADCSMGDFSLIF